jgi:hypothetical protein
MIIIGGGIRASENPGKLITASYPKADLSAWKVSARDHIVPDSSPITGFAIGLQILDFHGTPIFKEQLMRFIHVTSVTSDVVPHPTASAPFWPLCTQLGGGFRVNYGGGGGNLAMSSFYDNNVRGFPNGPSDGWTARSKDLIIPSPASITAYTIAIENFIVGPLDENLRPLYNFSVADASSVGPFIQPANHPFNDALLNDNFVITGGGTEVSTVSPNGAGNFLWKLHPFIDEHGGPNQKQGFSAASKDHILQDPAKMLTKVFGFDLVPQ